MAGAAVSPFWRRRRREAELDDEIRGHLAMAAREHEAHGESPREAAYAARREFGNATLVKEITRSMWRGERLADLGRDLRVAVRSLRRRPGFSAVVIGTLALGLGVNTGVFTIANAVLLRPPPYPHPDELVIVSEPDLGEQSFGVFTAPDYAELSRLAHSYMDIAAYAGLQAIITGGGEAEVLRGARVTASYFRALGVRPIHGRLFTGDDEEKPAGDRAVLISEALWRRRYAGDPRVVGSSLRLDGVDRLIVGVIPQDSRGPATWAELWTPMVLTAADLGEAGRHSAWLQVIGRLRSGVSLPQARALVGPAARAIAMDNPSSNASKGIGLISMWRFASGGVRAPLLLLLGASGLVLLIACANIASLLLVHATTRERELAIRSALGASRTRVLRPLLTETAVLATAGCVLALVVSHWAALALVALQPGDFTLATGLTHVGADSVVVGFALLLTTGMSVALALFLAARVAPGGIRDLIASVGRAPSGGRASRRIRNALVVAETALAVVLLSGAGLMLRSLGRMMSVDPGFESREVLALKVPLLAFKYASPAAQATAYQRLLENAGTVPGVQRTALVDYLPFGLSSMGSGFTIEGRSGSAARGGATLMVVSGSYFLTMGIPVLMGRAFSPQDRPGSQGVAIINRAAAAKYWPGESPLGQRLRLAGARSEPVEIVGVVENAKSSSLRADAGPQLYRPYLQAPSSDMWLVARAAPDPLGVAPALRRAIRETDPDQPIERVATMAQMIMRTAVSRRALTILLGALGGLALGLATVGIYGIVSQSAAQRTHEIGVRRALGASTPDVTWLVLQESLLLAFVGVVAGLGCALAFTRVLRKMLFQVDPHDPQALAGACLLLVGVALAAAVVPAIRAARVDPMAALRYE